MAVEEVWVCTPRTTAEVVLLANWARHQKYKLRAGGHGHNFSPLTVACRPGEASRTVVADMTKHFTAMGVLPGQRQLVCVGAGASMTALLTYLEGHDYGVTAAPATGEVTVGGVLAVGAHGTAVPAAREQLSPGHTYGSFSNLVVALSAVVWDNSTDRYVARTFHRSHPDCSTFLVHLGRAFVTEVVLRVGTNTNLRCASDLMTPASCLLAPPGSVSPRTFAALIDRSGRVEVIWFPYGDQAWTKVWTVRANRPTRSRLAPTPYNYSFSDNVPEPVSAIVSKLVRGAPELAPELGAQQYTAAALGLATTASNDLWGPSRSLLLYVKPTTLRYSTCGYAVLARRRDIQRVVYEFAEFVRLRLRAYTDSGRYPLNGPIELRVTGLDRASDLDMAWARPPALSPVAPDRNHPQFDVAVWLNILTFPGTPHAADFYREVEAFVFSNYRPPYAAARVEWSKGWGYTADGAWTDEQLVTATVPGTFGRSWRWASDRLTAYDPHRVFTNGFLDRLFS